MTGFRDELYRRVAEDYRAMIRQGIAKALVLDALQKKYYVSIQSIRKHIDLNTLDAEFGEDFKPIM